MSVVVSQSEADTQRIARDLAQTMLAGEVLLLSGDLGAGKTTFVRGLAEGLGIPPDAVSSPTFALVHEYRSGRLVLYHADLYRLDAAGAGELGLEELGVRDGILVIEWPDRLTHDLAGARTVDLQTLDERTRRITVHSIR